MIKLNLSVLSTTGIAVRPSKIFRETTCFTIMTACLLCFSACLAGAQSVTGVKRVSVPPVLDGKLDDDCWKHASRVNLLVPGKDVEPGEKTAVYLLCTGEKLYIGFECRESQMEKLAAFQKSRDNAFYTCDDNLSVFILPDYNSSVYYQFSINPAGTQRDLKMPRKPLPGFHVIDQRSIYWDGSWEAKTFTCKDRWTAEMAIPFALFEINPEFPHTWGISFGRDEKPGRQKSVWPSASGWDKPEEFGFCKIDNDFSRFCYEVEVLSFGKRFLGESLGMKKVLRGADHLNVRVKNDTILDEKLKLVARTVPFSKRPVVCSENILLEAGGEKNVLIPYEEKETGKQTMFFEIYNSRGELVYSKVYRLKVTPEIELKPNLSYYTDEREAGLRVTVNEPSVDLQNLSLVITVNDSSGKRTVYQKKMSGFSSKTSDFFIPVSQLKNGLYKVTASVYKKGRKVPLFVSKNVISKYPPMAGEVKIDKWNNVLVVNGEPFMPVGWSTLGRPEDLDALEKEGFDLDFHFLHTGAATDYHDEIPSVQEEMPALKAVLDRAARNNIKVLVGVSSLMNMRGYNPAYDAAFAMEYFKACIKVFRNHPAVLGWHIADEPELHSFYNEETVEREYKIVKEADPYHPVFVGHCISSCVNNYDRFADVTEFDPYPLPRSSRAIPFFDSFEQLCYVAEVGQTYNGEEKPLMMVLQAFPWCAYEAVDVPFRIPSRQEIRCMFYLSLVRGARLFWFFDFNCNRGETWNAARDGGELWRATAELAAELKELREAILSFETEKKVVMLGGGNAVETALGKDGGAVYLFAVNKKDQKMRVRFENLPVSGGKAEVLFENRKIDVDGGCFEDDFPEFSVHIYRISGNI